MTSMVTHGKSERDRLVESERMLRAYSNGTKVSDLAEEFSLAIPTVYRRLQLALDARIAPTVDEYRTVQNASLDETMAQLEAHLVAAEELIRLGVNAEDAALIERGMNQRMRALDSRLKVLDRRAKLNGLDVPVTAQVMVTQVTQEDIELAELTRDMKAASHASP